VRIANDMPPPFCSPCGRRSASRRRADRRACRRQRSSSFPRSVHSHADHYSCLCVNAAVSKPGWWPWPFTLKVVSESRVMWAICLPILVFLGLSVLELFQMCVTDVRCQTDVRQKHR